MRGIQSPKVISRSLLHRAEMTFGNETDPADMMNKFFTTMRKGGRVSVVGV